MFDDALYDSELDAFAEEQRAHTASLMELTAGMSEIDTASPDGLQWLRDAMEPGGLFGMQCLDFPETRTIDGPAGPIPIRVMTPERVDGVYLHFHGGGMTLGSARGMDTRNWAIAQACDVAVVSVDYRLAPEHPFPDGPDDCEAAALWLAENVATEFGTTKLLVGGESAGAYFSALTMIRLRDRLGGCPPYAGVDLCYGAYDLSGTPSTVLMRGKVPYATAKGDNNNRRHYLGDRTDTEVRDPAISPMYADLHDLPPMLLSVGTRDWLLDDSLFFAARLLAAGNRAELAVYPEAPHGIDGAPTKMGEICRERMYAFMRRCLNAA